MIFLFQSLLWILHIFERQRIGDLWYSSRAWLVDQGYFLVVSPRLDSNFSNSLLLTSSTSSSTWKHTNIELHVNKYLSVPLPKTSPPLIQCGEVGRGSTPGADLGGGGGGARGPRPPLSSGSGPRMVHEPLRTYGFQTTRRSQKHSICETSTCISRDLRDPDFKISQGEHAPGPP